VYALTCGCTLLLSGSLADLFGCRIMYLIGASLLIAFTLGCGMAKTGIQLITFRAFSGISLSLCLPSATSMITKAFPVGRGRNIAFACYGAAQPLGFSLGLVLAGALIQSIGWRACYYIVTGVTFISFIAATWLLPQDDPRREPLTLRSMMQSVDWIGAAMASSSLGLFSYVLAVVTASSSRLRSPANITMLSIATLLVPAFVFWIQYQERRNRAAIIPPSLFRSTTGSPHRARIFTATCLSVFLIFGSFNALTFFTTLFYQGIQHLSPLSTSPRFLPMVLTGTATNIVTGMLVHRVNANKLVIGAAVLTTIAPLLMAVANPNWSYFSAIFVAMLFSPIATDTMFTIANLIITEVFPHQIHGLAGGVFNTIAQIGNSVGLAVSAVVAGEVTKAKEAGLGQAAGEVHISAVLDGYRASFWTSLAASAVVVGIAGWGLRGSGKVGLKRE
jgi:MFS family permease